MSWIIERASQEGQLCVCAYALTVMWACWCLVFLDLLPNDEFEPQKVFVCACFAHMCLHMFFNEKSPVYPQNSSHKNHYLKCSWQLDDWESKSLLQLDKSRRKTQETNSVFIKNTFFVGLFLKCCEGHLSVNPLNLLERDDFFLPYWRLKILSNTVHEIEPLMWVEFML